MTSRCIGCYEIKRVTHAGFNREGGEKTVEWIVLSGAQLNEEQKELVIY